MHGRSLLAIALVGGLALSPNPTPTLEAATTPAARPRSIVITELSGSLADISARVAPAVVQIVTTGYVPRFDSDLEDLLSRRQQSGSGVILDPAGYVLTNAHVVAGAQRIQVQLALPAAPDAPGRSILRPRGKLVEGRVVGVDPETDLAVIRVEQSGLPALTLGDSDLLRPGELVLAFGSPLGFSNSVTMGVVSAIGRQLEPEGRVVYIQTDTPINPGNSGGPLVDAQGRVVGINTLIVSRSGGSEGVGFAVPSNIAKNVFDQLKADGRVSRGMIGARTQTISPALASGLSLPRAWGVLVSDVTPGAPAARFGLEIGDVIHTLDGKVVENARQFEVNLYRHRVGESATLEVLRGARRLTIQIPVVERRDDPSRFAAMVTPDGNLVPRLGILGVSLEPPLVEMLPPLRRASGVLVAASAPGSVLWPGGLAAGDVIHAVNGHAVDDLARLRDAVARLGPGQTAIVQVERSGGYEFVTIELR
jgi:serine protease Do